MPTDNYHHKFWICLLDFLVVWNSLLLWGNQLKFHFVLCQIWLLISRCESQYCTLLNHIIITPISSPCAVLPFWFHMMLLPEGKQLDRSLQCINFLSGWAVYVLEQFPANWWDICLQKAERNNDEQGMESVLHACTFMLSFLLTLQIILLFLILVSSWGWVHVLLQLCWTSIVLLQFQRGNKIHETLQ